jgi:MOSC domain-containing protein YiiM
VSSSPRHRFSKQPQDAIVLVAGHGVEGDAHAGATVQHRYVKRWRPHLPNLRQVHLLGTELLDELNGAGFSVGPGDLGENVLTAELALLDLPVGTRLELGDGAAVELTGLRTPCVLLDRFQAGLMPALLDRDADGGLVRRAGVMGVVVAGGEVRPGDGLRVTLPPGPHTPLPPV